MANPCFCFFQCLLQSRGQCLLLNASLKKMSASVFSWFSTMFSMPNPQKSFKIMKKPKSLTDSSFFQNFKKFTSRSRISIFSWFSTIFSMPSPQKSLRFWTQLANPCFCCFCFLQIPASVFCKSLLLKWQIPASVFCKSLLSEAESLLLICWIPDSFWFVESLTDCLWVDCLWVDCLPRRTDCHWVDCPPRVVHPLWWVSEEKSKVRIKFNQWSTLHHSQAPRRMSRSAHCDGGGGGTSRGGSTAPKVRHVRREVFSEAAFSAKGLLRRT